MSLFLEDFQPGDVRETGSVIVTKEEIIAFAREFDPQPFHVDEEAARRSLVLRRPASSGYTSPQ